MKFFTSAFALASLLISVVSAVDPPNPISAPAAGEALTAGTTYTVKWTANTEGKVTLKLRKGDSKNLAIIGTLASVENTGSYLWSIAAGLTPGEDYAIEIDAADGTPNYTGLFTILKAQDTTSSSVTASSTEATASSTDATATATDSKTSTSVTSVSNTTMTTTKHTTMLTSTMLPNATLSVVPTGANSTTITSFSKTSSSKPTDSATTTSAKATPTNAAARISGAGAMMAVAAIAAALVL